MPKQKKKVPAASLKRRKWGLGLPIHINMLFIVMNMSFMLINICEYINTLLVLARAITRILPLLLSLLGWNTCVLALELHSLEQRSQSRGTRGQASLYFSAGLEVLPPGLSFLHEVIQ